MLDGVFTQAGWGSYTSLDAAATIGTVIGVVDVVCLVVAIAIAVPRLRAHRTAFWVPLAAGASALVLTAVLTVVAAAVDPAFASR